MKKKYTVALFEDNRVFTNALRALLKDSEFELSGCFSNCSNLISDLSALQPDIILMDIDMPGKSGIEAVRSLRRHGIDTPILMQTVFDEEEKIFDAISSGANGYILKEDVTDKIVSSLHDVLSGGSPLSSAVAAKVIRLFHFFANTERDSSGTKDYQLSKREKEILSYLTKGFSYKMIPDTTFISYNTVHTHIKSIYKKLHVASMTEAVSKALKEKII